MYTVPPFSASLISLMDSVDVKHHVYLLGQIVRRPGLAKRYGVSEDGGRLRQKNLSSICVGGPVSSNVVV